MAIAKSNFLNKVYNAGFTPDFCVSMLKETIVLIRDYVYQTRKEKAKLTEKYKWNWNIKSFSDKKLFSFFRKF